MTVSQVQFLATMLRGRIAKAQRLERGASAVEWVVISAILIAIAAAIGLILMNKLKGKADSLDLNKEPGGGGGGVN
ncbi:MAG: hypothetical protein ACXVDH_06650 [Nocardioides sp.]|uniref:hypothetical protein n=1 Tax=Nocardioides nematodiphilus TaxID=2849669 RepID=UPI001CDA001E|nr:hypothetical protein [Nocardioides nematodiphilus]MCA1983991.1 hypothetical protein [Nocardioides nematodiphilus]